MKFNAVPHLCWLVAVLLAVIAFLILHGMNGNEVNEYISFASSLASLILAVVAIFYAIIANNSFSDSVSALRSSSDAIGRDSNQIKGYTESLSNSIDDLNELMNDVPKSIRTIGDDIKTQISTLSAKDVQQVSGSETTSGEVPSELSDGSFALGVSVAFYCIKLGNDSNKSFKCENLFSSKYVEGIVFGVVSFVAGTSYCGCKIDHVEDNFHVKDIGSLDLSSFAEILTHAGGTVAETKEKLDKYFLKSENEVASGEQ